MSEPNLKMTNLLKQISEKAIELADFEFSQEQAKKRWLGNQPASELEITRVEKRLGALFPIDFKQFLLITNGFASPNDIEPTFEPLSKIDYLKNINPDIIKAYSLEGIENIGKQLEKSIIVGGINEEQYFLLIPPDSTNKNWKYWKFANWYPGEEEYKNLENYFEKVLEFMNY